MTTCSPPVKIVSTGKEHTPIHIYKCTNTQTEDTVFQVKVMDLKNVLINSLYNTIS